MLVVLTGGARSGKSVAATSAAAHSSAPVVFIATAEPRDDEMTSRIERHRAERPPGWTTVEAPRDLLSAVKSVEPAATVIIDCLALWVTNLMLQDPTPADGEVVEQAELLAALLQDRYGTALVVTNEVGSGIVPATPLGRDFRDLLGVVNQTMVRAADAAYLVVAGRLLPLVEEAAALRV